MEPRQGIGTDWGTPEQSPEDNKRQTVTILFQSALKVFNLQCTVVAKFISTLA